MKNKEIFKRDECLQDDGQSGLKKEMTTKLDPFVPLILKSFKTYHTPIVTTSLHIMTLILDYDLPSFRELQTKFLNRIFKLFE